MLLTVVDPRHRRHPEVGVVLAIERVAVSIYRVVEVRIIPIQEGEGVGSQRKGTRMEDFQHLLFPGHLLCANSLRGHHLHSTKEEKDGAQTVMTNLGLKPGHLSSSPDFSQQAT